MPPACASCRVSLGSVPQPPLAPVQAAVQNTLFVPGRVIFIACGYKQYNVFVFVWINLNFKKSQRVRQNIVGLTNNTWTVYNHRAVTAFLLSKRGFLIYYLLQLVTERHVSPSNFEVITFISYSPLPLQKTTFESLKGKSQCMFRTTREYSFAHCQISLGNVTQTHNSSKYVNRPVPKHAILSNSSKYKVLDWGSKTQVYSKLIYFYSDTVT